MDVEKKVTSLMNVAKGSRDDAESLYRIAGELQQLSAWDDAETVRGWALDAERKQAEKVGAE